MFLRKEKKKEEEEEGENQRGGKTNKKASRVPRLLRPSESAIGPLALGTPRMPPFLGGPKELGEPNRSTPNTLGVDSGLIPIPLFSTFFSKTGSVSPGCWVVF